MNDEVHRSLVWLKDGGAELSEVKLARSRLSALGCAIGSDPVPYRLEYVLTTGESYVTSSLRVHTSGVGWRRSVELHRDGNGRWRFVADAEGGLDAPPPGGDASLFDGALDCDLGLSPLTNTMPMLRHGLLSPAGSVDLLMAWVSVPGLAISPSAQRYTPISQAGSTSVVRFDSEGFGADIVVDHDGFVLDYPGIGHRPR
ncbi:MAG TPA: putative glycolipid-binding domain-containing protein [Actinopolymorphaceae bacterium]|nr:putative glycolipid-binding domain-containing protein [Actinopolymorphaceae bacterium]